MLLKNGQYTPNLSDKDRKKMFFVGNYKNPIAIGTRGQIMDLVDEQYWYLFDLYRWFKCGMLDLNFKDTPYGISNAIRAFSEVDR